MSDFFCWKYVLVVFVLVFGIVYVLFNVFLLVLVVQVQVSYVVLLDVIVQQKVVDVLKQQNIVYIGLVIDGDYLVVNFVNVDVQVKVLDVIKVVLGDNYIVVLNLVFIVLGWLCVIYVKLMLLGLDLQGGVYFLMVVDQDSVIDKQEECYVDDICNLLCQKNICYDLVVCVVICGQGINIVLCLDVDCNVVVMVIVNEYFDFNVNNGDSIGDCFMLSVVVKLQKLCQLVFDVIWQNVGMLCNCVNVLGVFELVIQQQGENQIVVELVGMQNLVEVKKVIGVVVMLEYYLGIGFFGDLQVVEVDCIKNVLLNVCLYYECGMYCLVLVSKQIIVSGDQLVDVFFGIDQQLGMFKVDVMFIVVGVKKMLDFISNNVGKLMVVVYVECVIDIKMVDGKEVCMLCIIEEVISDVIIQGVFGKQFQIIGLFSLKEVFELVLLFKGGLLVVLVDIVLELVFSFSLGQDNINKGFKVVLLGLVLVLLVVVIYYKLFGLVVDIVLFFNLVILLVVMLLIGVMLIMLGIVGIVLMLGMVIDVNVLICECICEELCNGLILYVLICVGYEKVWVIILDVNVIYLIVVLVLIMMGLGLICGFGIMLLIGILILMFILVIVMYVIIVLIYGYCKFKMLLVQLLCE